MHVKRFGQRSGKLDETETGLAGREGWGGTVDPLGSVTKINWSTSRSPEGRGGNGGALKLGESWCSS